MPEADLGDQALKPWPTLGRDARAAQVVIDDNNSWPRPAQPASPAILHARGLAMVLQLLQGGLADIDQGDPVKVAVLDLAR